MDKLCSTIKENIMDKKKWYQSKTIIGSVVAVLGMILSAFGYGLNPDEQAQLSAIVVSVGGSVGGVLAIYGRVKATHKLEK